MPKVDNSADEHIHKIYSRLLATLTLTPEHGKALNKRGFSPADCERLGYRTLPLSRKAIVEKLQAKADLSGVPGFWRDDTGVWQLAGKCGIIFPVRDSSGRICALKIRVDKPSNPSAKYLLLSSNPKADKRTGEVKYPNGASAPLRVHFPLDKPKKIKSMRVTEGEIKADIATAMLPQYTISIPGVTGWRMALEAIRELKPEEVRLAFDSDKSRALNSEGSSDSSYENKTEEKQAPNQEDFAVGKTLASLYLALREAGEVKRVIIEDWPHEAGKGIDDVLMNGSTDLISEMSDEQADTFAGEMLRADLPDGWIYVVGVKRFYHTRNLLELDKEQFADRYAHETKGNAASKALGNPSFPKVDAPIYTPGAPMLTKDEENNIRYFNTWRANKLQPKKGSVKIFLEHCAYIFPEEREREIVLDWLAWQVQRPGEKVHWALLVQGVQGTGKSFFGKVMRLLLGERNVSLPTNEQMHEKFTEWQKACQLVIIEELMARGRLELMNKLKPMITQDLTIVREMQKPSYSQPNVFNFLMFTNHEDAIILDATDRRYCVIFSPAQPKSPEYYSTLWDWLLANTGPMLAFFLARDISSFLPHAHAPMTSGKAQLIASSSPPLQAYIEEALADEKWPLAADIISIGHLVEVLPTTLRNNATAQSVGKVFKALGFLPLSQVKLKNGARTRLWAVRRKEVWESATPETLAGEYEKWLAGSQPGGSPEAVNPLRDTAPM